MQVLLKSSILVLAGMTTASVKAQSVHTHLKQGGQTVPTPGRQPGTGAPLPTQNTQNPAPTGAMAVPARGSQQGTGAPQPQNNQNTFNQNRAYQNGAMFVPTPAAQQGTGAPLPLSSQNAANQNGANALPAQGMQQGTGSPVPQNTLNQPASQNTPLATGLGYPQGTIYPGGYQGYNFLSQGAQPAGIVGTNTGLNPSSGMTLFPQGTQPGTGAPLPQNGTSTTGIQPGTSAVPTPGTQTGTGAPIPPDLQNTGNQAPLQNNLAANAYNVEVFGQLNATPWFADPIVRARLNLSNDQANMLGRAYAQSLQAYQSQAAVYQNQQNLTPEQRQNLAQLHQQFYADFGRFSNIILEGNLNSRFSQLGLQYRGYQALLDPAISQRLQLNNDQLSQLARFSQEQERQYRQLYTPGTVDPSSAEARFVQLRREMSERIDQVLTSSQRQAWKELLGDPFDFIYRGY